MRIDEPNGIAKLWNQPVWFAPLPIHLVAHGAAWSPKPTPHAIATTNSTLARASPST